MEARNFADFSDIYEAFLPASWFDMTIETRKELFQVALRRVTEFGGIRLPPALTRTLPRKNCPPVSSLFRDGKLYLPDGAKWEEWLQTTRPYRTAKVQEQICFLLWSFKATNLDSRVANQHHAQKHTGRSL